MDAGTDGQATFSIPPKTFILLGYNISKQKKIYKIKYKNKQTGIEGTNRGKRDKYENKGVKLFEKHLHVLKITAHVSMCRQFRLTKVKLFYLDKFSACQKTILPYH